MIKSGYLEVLSQEDLEQIHEASLSLLEDVGVRVPYEPLLELVRDAGARVDFDKQIVRFPAPLVEDLLKRVPSSFKWHARNPQYDMHLGGDTINYIGASTLVTVFDLEGCRRPATLQDARDFTRLKDALPNIQDSYTAVHPRDVPDYTAHAHQLYIQFKYSQKPARARMFGTQISHDCIRMAQVVAGSAQALRERPNLLVVINTVSPLSHAREQMEALVEYARAGFPLFAAPEVQAGGTGPVTLAGSFAQQNAEILSVLCMAQIINPGLGVGYGTVSSVLDMRNGIMPYSSPEACLFNIATAQFGRFYHIPSRGTAGFTDANLLDMQAGFETGMTMLVATLAGINLILGAAGSLENALAASYEKFVIDDEVISYIKRVVRGVEVTPETLALDVIRSVGPGGNFLGTQHTLKNFKREHFIPALSNRAKYDSWVTAGAKPIHMLAREKASRILREHQPAPLDPAVEEELLAILHEIETRGK